MKKQKIKVIFVLTLLVITGTIIVSYFIDSNSQKLPAVVRSNKVFVSTEVSGTIANYFVASMQEVKKGQAIAKLENPRLTEKLKALRSEYDNYNKLVKSAEDGDILKLELFKIEKDILETFEDIQKAEYKLNKLYQELDIQTLDNQSAIKKYNSIKKLYEEGKISQTEYDLKAKEYLSIINKYANWQAESSMITKELEASKTVLKMQKAQRDIINSNTAILASKNLIELDKIRVDIADLEHDIENLTILSPLDGVVTGLRNRPGERVKNGDVIAEISDISDVWLTAYGSSYSNRELKEGNKVTIYSNNKEKIAGVVFSISPVMEKVKSLSATSETVNTYTKIKIGFIDHNEAMKHLTPGERLFVRISLD